MNGWSLVYQGFEPRQEDLREALCTLGNGFFATRGAAPEAAADDVHYPGTYLAGGYNRLKTEIAGRTVENEDLVNFPNWLPLTFRFEEGEEWFDLRRMEILDYCQELDLRRGLLHRDVRFRDRQGRRTHLSQRRLVHLMDPHLAALETTLTAENWSGAIEFRSALDGRVVNDGVRRYRQLANRHLEALAANADDETLFLRVRTSRSRLEMAQAARTRLFLGGRPLKPERQVCCEPGYVAHLIPLHLNEGEGVRVEKVVSLFTSRDRAIAEAGVAAHAGAAQAGPFEELLADHALAWRHLWGRFNIDLADDSPETAEAATILRLHIFHLLQTVSMHTMDLDVGVPSRGWHGEAYRGHVFWDELYIFPFLNLRMPEITRALLKYRYRRLGEARANARAAGFRGAMYPWQSGSDGREESQTLHLNPESGRWLPDHTRLQRHVNAAIVWNVWQYYQVTGDAEFLSFHGAEMILEIARFWASLASWNEEAERFEIRGVMGPDEYHDAYPGAETPGLANNAYTNVMAAWVLRTALEVLLILPDDRRQELKETLGVQPEETDLWDRISRRLRLCFHQDGKIISQFEGYGELEEFDWDRYRRRHGPVMRLDRILEAEGDTPNRYQVSKQADVLMLFYLFSSEELNDLFERLGYPFDYETIPRNIDYYLQRTSHGSTLSQIVHSWVLARSDRDQAWELFRLALRTDIGDVQGGTTPEGIHLGAMAGTVDLVQRCFTGLETRGDVLHFNPCLPRGLSRLGMHIRYRGQSLAVVVTPERLRISCLQCGVKPIRIAYREEEYQVHGGETKEFLC